MSTLRSNLEPVPDADADDPAAQLAPAAGGLSIPRLRVTPGQGPAYTVQALNPDLLRFEDTAARHHWAGPATAPFRWLTFLAWSASKRTGLTTATWEAFAETTLQVENLEAAAAVPTPPGPGPG